MFRKIFLPVLITISISILSTTNLPADPLVAYWSFEEVDADVLIDHSGTGNDGQVNGDPEWVDGPFGKAMEFDGVDDFVLVPNHESYNFTQDDSFSISLWINYQPKGDWQGPLQKFNGGYPFKVEVDTANQLYFAIYDGVNFPQAYIGDFREEWHHCGCVRDVDAGKLYAYLDGELKAEVQDTTNAEIANAADLYIGARKPGNTITYVGMLDEIAIYNRVLTEDEIRQAADGRLPEVDLAVEYFHKLSTTWGDIRRNH